MRRDLLPRLGQQGLRSLAQDQTVRRNPEGRAACAAKVAIQSLHRGIVCVRAAAF
jgi:hypothetical protein